MPESASGFRGETRAVVGKHAGQRSSRSRWGGVLVGATVVGLLLAGVTWVFLTAGGGVDAADGGPSTGGSSSTTSSEPALAKAQRTMAACRDHLTAGERLAKAAAVAARDWRTHTDGQLKLTRGEWTVTQAEEAWEETRARGADVVRSFTAAMDGVKESSGAAACRALPTDTASTELAEKGKACASRDKALNAVASAGAVVNSQWAEHLEMMADQPHTDAASYRDRWLTMVEQAQAPLKRYEAAADALADAPACPA